MCYGTGMPSGETRVNAAGSTSARIIAAGIVIAFCYWASTVLVTLLVSVLLAYFLDPVVTWMEEWHMPRALGSLLVVLVTLTLLAILGVSLVARIDQFGADWPKYREPLRAVTETVAKKISNLEAHVSE
ncbi:MAG: AI-2E family transporter, partial [Candidatus Acidiferrales bacterium]